jgi:hypothetical protein
MLRSSPIILTRQRGCPKPAISACRHLMGEAFRMICTLERLFIRDLIRWGEREGRKIDAIRHKIQVRREKKDHARGGKAHRTETDAST